MKKTLILLACLSVLLPISYATADSNKPEKYSEEQMLTNFVKTNDPALDLYYFAKENNLSLETAKKILTKHFGIPEVSKEEYFNSIARTKNPDEDLRRFAHAKHMTLDEAKDFLTDTFGKPQMP